MRLNGLVPGKYYLFVLPIHMGDIVRLVLDNIEMFPEAARLVLDINSLLFLIVLGKQFKL